ncbi:MAG: hypothetical protein MJE68_22415 [Proteobacteria bacterium]|nr:hypothetical protein [Pseudomonadota bacterium]
MTAPDKDIIIEKQCQQRQGISRHVPSREGRLSVSTSPNGCSSASPMNALDDILYSQASPAAGSTLTQSKDETGLQVAFVSFFTDCVHALKSDLLQDKFNRSSEAARRKEKIFAGIYSTFSSFSPHLSLCGWLYKTTPAVVHV